MDKGLVAGTHLHSVTGVQQLPGGSQVVTQTPLSCERLAAGTPSQAMPETFDGQIDSHLSSQQKQLL